MLNIINIILLKGTISNRFSIQPFGMFYLSVSVLVSSFIFLSEYKQQCNWTQSYREDRAQNEGEEWGKGKNNRTDRADKTRLKTEKKGASYILKWNTEHTDLFKMSKMELLLS